MNAAIRKWIRKRNRRKAVLALARNIADHSGRRANDETWVIDLSRYLDSHEMTTLELIPGFLSGLSYPSSGANAIVSLVANSADSSELRMLMRHYEFIENNINRHSNTANFVTNQLVAKCRLDEWRLPIEHERSIIGMIIELRNQKRQVGDWFPPFVINNPDKADRAMEMLLKREVDSLEAMEVLLDSDIPMVIQDGAL